ncbi:MAG: D-alanyl-D-alanine carboxypeptidase/D-alanyl-D-alanine-endopeptidase [Sedimentisphaerales bacterium]|nr:D-alanyl-D-alanine carboxypeptidase/D-alanyl-D-alanine-endopeptidase [Sedimentisphaerales bacterium]
MQRLICLSWRRGIPVFLLSVWLCGVATGALAERIDKIVGKRQGGAHSIRVVQADSGATVYSHRADRPLIPASNMKLVTTAAALDYLGADFEYTTKVGLCDDTLVVVGSGDPLLGDKETDAQYGRQEGWIFEGIAQALQDQGIQEINDIIVDTTVFDDERVHANWPAKDHNKWYACEVSGLNYNGNCIEVIANRFGSSVAVSVEPRTNFVQIINEVKAISNGDGAVGAYRNRHPNKITIFGKCKNRQGPFRVAIEQPAAFFGYLLAENLVRVGINATGKLIEKSTPDDCEFRLLVEFATPVADVLGRANTDSLGLAAEALLKTIAAHESDYGTDGSWEAGRELVGRYLSGLGIASEEFHIDDGSGLSRENRLSAHAISTMLLALYRSDDWELYKGSLAVGGEDGTIGRYFKEAQYRGKIVGKTGYISGVRSFSGVCHTQKGPYIFSIISNGPRGLSRDEINDIAKAVIDEFGSTE